MAFGFEPHKETQSNIDYSRCTPINVIAVTNQERKIKPLYFSVEDAKVKIDGIKYTKDGKGCTSFCCLYQVGSRQRECILAYYHMEHIWVLNN